MKNLMAIAAVLAALPASAGPLEEANRPANQHIVRPEHAVIRPQAVLPPAEYDHPYKGIMVTTVAKDLEQLLSLCKKKERTLLACSYRYSTGCLVVLAKRERIEAAGFTVDIVKRHENGHCNGWPGLHPGARTLQEAGPQQAAADSVVGAGLLGSSHTRF